MSTDWDKRQGILGKHKHLNTDVLDEATMGTYTGGGAQTIRLLRSASIAFDAVGLINPSDSGFDTGLVIPEGSYLLRTEIARTVAWSHRSLAECYVGVDTSDTGVSGRFDLSAGGIGSSVPLWAGDLGNDTGQLRASMPKLMHANGADFKIFLSLFPLADDPTAGECQVLAVIAEPSA